MTTRYRWLLTDYAHAWDGNTLYVIAVTDRPCHMTLWWTPSAQIALNITKNARGWLILCDPSFTEAQFTAVDQNEVGDTLSHTFSFGPWSTGDERWWFFKASYSGLPTSSTSITFHAIFDKQANAQSASHTDLANKDPGGVIDHADQSVTPAKLETPFTFDVFPLTPAESPTSDYEVANKAYVDAALSG